MQGQTESNVVSVTEAIENRLQLNEYITKQLKDLYGLRAGDTFLATDENGRTFKYRVVSHLYRNSSSSFVVLANLTMQETSNVELDWFNERKIKKVGK